MTTSITLDCTSLTVTVPGTRMAVGHATFGNLCRAAGMGDLAVLSQVHIDRADDDFAALVGLFNLEPLILEEDELLLLV